MLIPCLACERRFQPDEYFPACHDYNRGMDLVAWTCPSCGNRDDLRVLPDAIGFGYPRRGRFNVQDRFQVPGLRRRRQDLRLDISLNKEVWRVPTTLRHGASTSSSSVAVQHPDEHRHVLHRPHDLLADHRSLRRPRVPLATGSLPA